MQKVLLSAFLIIFLSQCTTPETKQEKETRVSQKIEVTPDFQPAAFSDPDRKEKLLALVPEIEKRFKDYAASNHYPGMVYGLVLDGELIWSGGVGTINLDSKVPVSNASLFRIASMSKSFTAMAIMKLRDDGKLRLTDPAANYIPEMADLTYLTSDAQPVTIQNLMTMTSGFPEDNPWGDRQLNDTDEDLINQVKEGISFSNIPGFAYEYSNLGYALLGHIVSVVAGQPYQQYIAQNIFQPLGMSHTYYEYEGLPADKLALGYRWEDEQWKKEPMLHDGAYGAMGGIITSLDDFSKYVAFHLAAWPPRSGNETGPVPRSTVREMHKPFLPRLYADATDADGNPCAFMAGYAYGLGWYQDCNGLVRVSHSGGLPGFGSEYRFFPEYGLGIISFANRTYAGTGRVNNEVMELIFKKSGLKPRELPVSTILAKRKEQVVKLLQGWEEDLCNEILAENFFLDFSKERRMKEANEKWEQIGDLKEVGEMEPLNQLRGSFVLHGSKGDMAVFFTLTPEKNQKVQQLILRVLEK